MTIKNKLKFALFFVVQYLLLVILNSTNVIVELLFGQIVFIFAAFFAFLPVINSIMRKNAVFTILFLFIFFYTYTLKYFYFDHLWLSFHQINVGTIGTINQVTSVIFIFNMLIWFFLKQGNEPYFIRLPVKYNNNLLFYFNITIFVLMAVFGNTNESILATGGYALSSGTGNRSSLTEYALIFLTASFLFTGSSKRKLLIIYLLSGLYCLKNLSQGGRIETVMVLFLILVFDIVHSFSFYKILFASLIPIVFLFLFSLIRNNPESIISIDGFNDMLSSILYKTPRSYISSNQGDVLFASERMFLLIKDNVLNFYTRIESFFHFIIAAFIPFKYLPPEANLSSYRLDLYSVGGGGLAPIYFFIYLSYVGILLLAIIFVKAIYGFTNKKINSFVYFYGLLVIISVPRWYAYYPIGLIKFCLIGAIYLFLLTRLNRLLKKETL